MKKPIQCYKRLLCAFLIAGTSTRGYAANSNNIISAQKNSPSQQQNNNLHLLEEILSIVNHKNLLDLNFIRKTTGFDIVTHNVSFTNYLNKEDSEMEFFQWSEDKNFRIDYENFANSTVNKSEIGIGIASLSFAPISKKYCFNVFELSKSLNLDYSKSMISDLGFPHVSYTFFPIKIDMQNFIRLSAISENDRSCISSVSIIQLANNEAQ